LSAQQFLDEAEASVLCWHKIEEECRLKQEIGAVLDAGKLPQKFFFWGKQKRYSDEALTKAKALWLKIIEIGLPAWQYKVLSIDDLDKLGDELSDIRHRSVSCPRETQKEAEAAVQKLRPIVAEIGNAIGVATQRASALADQRASAKVKREECESRKLEKEQAVKALAAAHLNKTRSLAAGMKRGLKQQISLLSYCPYCQGSFDSGADADHIYPVCKGGLSTHKNMVYGCSSCNSRKSSLTLLQFIRAYQLNQGLVFNCLSLLGKDY